MKYLKYCLLLSFCFFFINAVQAQKKKIYMLVDTVTISPESRIVEISGRGEVFYTFYCKCVENKENIAFAYWNLKPEQGITDKRPNENYISWKKLVELVDNSLIDFGEKYELYITELLPDKRYKTNRVIYILPRIAY